MCAVFRVQLFLRQRAEELACGHFGLFGNAGHVDGHACAVHAQRRKATGRAAIDMRAALMLLSSYFNQIKIVQIVQTFNFFDGV
jgi:hypothetical protein